MKLYIGGDGCGQDVLAARENPGAEIIYDMHSITRDILRNGGSIVDYAIKLSQENPDAVVVCNEIGLGIHPFEMEDRVWREETGRALCVLAEKSESVTRVICGIAQRIK